MRQNNNTILVRLSSTIVTTTFCPKMELSWKAESQEYYSRIFDDSFNVWMFLLYFENVAARKNQDVKKQYENITHFNWDAFKLLFSRFTKDGAVMAEALDLKKVKVDISETSF